MDKLEKHIKMLKIIRDSYKKKVSNKDFKIAVSYFIKNLKNNIKEN